MITLAEYKAFEGKTKTDDDVKTTVIIGAVTNLIKTYLGTSAPDDPTSTITETLFLDYDTDRLYTKYYPIREVISIVEHGRNPYDSSVQLPLVSGSEYIVVDEYILRVKGTTQYTWWPVSPAYVVVQYKAGVVDEFGDPIPTPTPADVKLAAIELVSYYLKKEYIQNRTLSGSTISTYVDKHDEMPPHIAKLLDPYKAYI